eukprot:CAMPEP_0184685608 /NCGR_PEP_ID=MMETSP0312-20130426/19516_1 /TAXON_ID=31354 /ORGANISM="Compsopogon coeruleus, Strain SAG 36.94" /LENGTH=126 /DNA_ID=CAMNT_0027139843 /DNA_START=60 /DNA_END=436 /DNA_ORIENTATION=+
MEPNPEGEVPPGVSNQPIPPAEEPVLGVPLILEENVPQLIPPAMCQPEIKSSTAVNFTSIDSPGKDIMESCDNADNCLLAYDSCLELYIGSLVDVKTSCSINASTCLHSVCAALVCEASRGGLRVG